MPPQLPRQAEAHDIRADGDAHAPKAVQPVHVPGGVVERHVVVQRGIHRSRPQAIRHRPQAQHPETPRKAEAQQRHRREKHAEGGHLSRPKPVGQTVRQQAGHHRAAGDDTRDDPRKRQRDTHLRIDLRPRSTQQRIRQTQADERQVNDRQQQGRHGREEMRDEGLYRRTRKKQAGKQESPALWAAPPSKCRNWDPGAFPPAATHPQQHLRQRAEYNPVQIALVHLLSFYDRTRQ